MKMHRAAMIGLAVMSLSVLHACGGDDDSDGAAAPTDSPDTTGAVATSPAATTPPTLAEVNILTDFGDVCRGVTLPGASPYDPARAGVHPLVALAGEDPGYETAGSGLPDTWAPTVGQEQTVELVACLDRTTSTLSQTCEGYSDDSGNESGTVEMYDASYDVELIAATSGDVVASTQMDATDADCPILVMFDANDPVSEQYAEPTDELTSWLADYVET